jgi:hypothetical protein
MAMWIVPDESDSERRVTGVSELVGSRELEKTIICEIEEGADYCVEIDNQRVDVLVAERDGLKYLCTPRERLLRATLSMSRCA